VSDKETTMTPNPRAVICAVVSAAVLIALLQVQAQTGSPQETLNQYISDLQKNPNDYALREKIIKLVQTMRPVPPTPEEARRYFIEGNALLKAAKAQKGYELAIDAYRQCLLIAPWWAEAYFNYAVALDLANRFDEAVNVLKLYIATNPGGEESRKAQDKIYEIGAKKKLAAQEREESSPQASATREQNKFGDLLRKIDGRRYTHSLSGGYKSIIDVRGKVLVWGNIMPNGEYSEAFCSEMRGRESPVPIDSNSPAARLGLVESTLIISEDGGRMTSRMRYKDGTAYEHIYLWQR
jgi:tetratricopeptide (TPR) repeat protein